jgi:hypothetical protein
MCQVQRVTNGCGHVNDHILMMCRLAKAASSFSSSAPGILQNLTNVQQGSNASTITTVTITTPTSPQTASMQGHPPQGVIMASLTSPSNQENLPPRREGSESSAVLCLGVPGRCHAWDEAYCINAIIRHLSSAKGFECMVPGCGRVG